jgi:DNA (cytosine-5)-methyltransferase 1
MIMRYFSMFTGIGGFELGIQQAYEILRGNADGNKDGKKQADKKSDGQNRAGLVAQEGESSGAKAGWLGERPANFADKRPFCVGYSEIDKYAIQVFEKHFPNIKNYGDCTAINAKELPEFDFLAGGFPCQSFSIAGRRRGFEDTRGTLFFDIARILKEKRPKHFLLENVKGLLSHDGGRTFKTIIAALAELGYRVEWQVLNSKNFEVPQNRERVFIVGHLGGESRGEIFPFGEEPKLHISQDGRKQESGQGICSTLDARYGAIRNSGETYIVPTIRATEYKHGDNQTLIVEPPHKHGEIRCYDRLVPTMQARWGTGGDNVPYVAEARIRRLTPNECERLQGFPDNWTAQGTQGPISDTQRYKMCGNAVTVNVAREIFIRLWKQNKIKNSN